MPVTDGINAEHRVATAPCFHGYRAALLVCAALAALGIVTSLLRGSEHPR